MNSLMTSFPQAATPRLILASGSQARRAVLHAAGLRVDMQPADLDEDVVKRDAKSRGLDAGAAALVLAGLKARQVEAPDALVLGADQILVCDGHWFDKPADLATAAAQLHRLRGREHVLHTALVVLRNGQEIWRHVATPRLRMRALSDAFIEAYVAAEGTPLLSCVGAYRLEALGIQLFESVSGEQAAILGLPLLPLLVFLRQQGVLAS
jgi:septum formation protein